MQILGDGWLVSWLVTLHNGKALQTVPHSESLVEIGMAQIGKTVFFLNLKIRVLF